MTTARTRTIYHNTIVLLDIIEELNRLTLLHEDNRSDKQNKRIKYIHKLLKHSIPNYKVYPPKPRGIAWAIDYTELIELSKIGREKLSAYMGTIKS